MSDLKELRDHAQRMAKSDHVDDCVRIHRITKLIIAHPGEYWSTVDVTLSCSSTAGHDPHAWLAVNGLEYGCPGLCGGCMTEPERKLWRQIARELDIYLTTPATEQGALPL